MSTNNENFRVNDQITSETVLLVGPEGGSKGEVRVGDALEFADNLGLDLVEIKPEESPPVCKVMDYGKHTYLMGVKAREARKNQPRSVTKEVRFRPTTEEHDYQTKLRQIKKFLNKSFRVKLSIVMRGREVTHPELATQMMERLASDLRDISVLDGQPSSESGVMSVVVAPAEVEEQV